MSVKSYIVNSLDFTAYLHVLDMLSPDLHYPLNLKDLIGTMEL